MKKIVNVFFLLVMSVVFFSSCESKDPEGRLTGKSYEYEYEERDLLFWGYTKEYKFYHNGDVSYKCDGYKKVSWGIDHDFLDYEIERQYLNYEVIGDVVRIYWDNEEKKELCSGIIKGNTIQIKEINSEGKEKIEIYTLK